MSGTAKLELEKIVSGGQTGADRAALDVALSAKLATGGWVPHGRRAEDGRIPARYAGLVETDASNYEHRTALNVRDSDATLVFSFGEPSGGTALTRKLALASGKPCLQVDLDAVGSDEAAERIRAWLAEHGIRVLNVAGPRASRDPRIAEAVTRALGTAIRGS